MNESQTVKPEVDAVRGDFTDTFRTLRNGAVAYEATEKLAEVVEAIRETGKKGSMTIKLEIAPFKTGDPSVLAVSAAIKSNLPEAPAAPTVFFPGEDNLLHRENPNQMRLPFERDGGKDGA